MGLNPFKGVYLEERRCFALKTIKIPVRFVLIFVLVVVSATAVKQIAGDEVLYKRVEEALKVFDHSLAFSLYDRILDEYPNSPYVKDALKYTLPYTASGNYQFFETFFNEEDWDEKTARPFSIGFKTYGVLTSIWEPYKNQSSSISYPYSQTELKFTAEERALWLYNNYREVIEEEPGRYGRFLYNAGLKEEAIPYLIEGLTLKERFPGEKYFNVQPLIKHAAQTGEYKKGAEYIDLVLDGEENWSHVVLYLWKAHFLSRIDETTLAKEAAKKGAFLYDKYQDSNDARIFKSEFDYVKRQLDLFGIEGQTSEIKVGVFVNGKPQKDVLVSLDYFERIMKYPSIYKTHEYRITDTNGSTGSFLRGPNDYKVELKLTPEQALPLEGGLVYVLVKGLEDTPVRSGIRDKNGFQCLSVKEGEKIEVEFHLIKPLKMQADKYFYDPEDSVELTWESCLGVDEYFVAFYYINGLGRRDGFKIAHQGNRLVINEAFFDQNRHFGKVIGMTNDMGYMYTEPQYLLGPWRATTEMTISVVPKTKEQSEFDVMSLSFSQYIGETEERKKDGLVVLKLNQEKLSPWEKLVVNRHYLEAWDLFQDENKDVEFSEEDRLYIVEELLRKEAKNRLKYEKEVEENKKLRETAKALVAQENYQEACTIYQELYRKDQYKLYVDMRLTLLAAQEYEQVERLWSRERDSDIERLQSTLALYKFRSNGKEPVILTKIAQALLKGELKTAMNLTKTISKTDEEGEILSEAAESLIALYQKYDIFND